MRRPAAIALFLGSASVACSERVFVGSDVIWAADHEVGDLSEWADGAAGADNTGEGEGTVTLTQEHVHSGRFAVKLTKDVDTSSVTRGGGPRLARVGLPTEAFYSAWYFVPTAYQTHSYWTIMQFDSPAMSNAVYDRGVDLQLRSLPDGGLVLQALFHNEAYLLAPLPSPAPVVPIGRWFQVEAHNVPPQSPMRTPLSESLRSVSTVCSLPSLSAAFNQKDRVCGKHAKGNPAVPVLA